VRMRRGSWRSGRVGVVAALMILASMCLAACTSHGAPSSEPHRHPPASVKAKHTKVPSHAVIPPPGQHLGALTILPTTAAQRKVAIRADVVARELPKGWSSYPGHGSLTSLPNCPGYPAGTLFGPVAGTPFVEGPVGATGVSSQAVVSAVWTAQTALLAKGVVGYLASAQGRACIASQSGGGAPVAISVPGASAVTAYRSAPRPPSTPGTLGVFFAKGRLVVMVVFLDKGHAFPLTVAAGVVDQMSAQA